MEQTAKHYAELSKKPGWRDYCRYQVREMESKDDNWRGLLDLVREKLKGDK